MLVLNANGIAQPWPEFPAQMERFLELAFLVVGRDEAKVTESRHEKTPLAEASGETGMTNFVLTNGQQPRHQ